MNILDTGIPLSGAPLNRLGPAARIAPRGVGNNYAAWSRDRPAGRVEPEGWRAHPGRADLADAARSGCAVAVVTTLPGSKSQENAQRRGFDLLYYRTILQYRAS